MTNIARQIRPALVLFLLLSVLTGLLYPLAMTGLGQALFPRQAGGSLLTHEGKIIGSTLIGQNFTRPEYFHGRLSATSGPDAADPTKTGPLPYNAAASAASNLGPTSRALADRAKASVAALKADNPDAVAAGLPLPVDLVTASGSGLDPEISPAAASFQAMRVAKARHLSLPVVQDLIARATRQPLMGWLGEKRVNVLELNLALDGMSGGQAR